MSCVQRQVPSVRMYGSLEVSLSKFKTYSKKLILPRHTANIKDGRKVKRSERKIRNNDKEIEPAENMRSQNKVRFDPDSDTDSEYENYNTYGKMSNPVQRSDMSVNAVHQEEAFATVVIYHDEPKVKGPLLIKTYTRSGGNALPLRTFKQMFLLFHQSKLYSVDHLSNCLTTHVTISNVLDPSI